MKTETILWIIAIIAAVFFLPSIIRALQTGASKVQQDYVSLTVRTDPEAAKKYQIANLINTVGNSVSAALGNGFDSMFGNEA